MCRLQPAAPQLLRLGLVGCEIESWYVELLVSLPSCGTLQELNLRNNELDTLPQGLFRMKRLQSLKLDHNRIAQLPPVHETSVLKILTVAHNQLFCIPASIKHLRKSLVILSLSDNKICFLPPELAELKRLQRLHIDCNQFTKFPCVIMTELRKLKEFSLDWFRYAHPVMSPKIREKDQIGSVIITYLQNICSNLLRYGRKDFSFITFLEIYATTATTPTSTPISTPTAASSLSATQPLPHLPLTDQGISTPPILSQGSSTLGDSQAIVSEGAQSDTLNQSSTEAASRPYSPGLSPIGLYLNKRDNRQRTALHRAAAQNHIGVLQALLQEKANLDLLDKEQLTPLCLAIREGNAQCAHMLLVAGADVNVGGGLFGSPLHMAVSKSEVWMVVDILKRGADPNVIDIEGNTPLHQVMKVFSKKAARSAMIAEHLVRRGAKPDVKNEDLWAPIHLATKNAQVDALRWVLEINQQYVESKGEENIFIDVNQPGGAQRHTALHLASFSGHFEIVEMLVESPFCDIFQRNYQAKAARQLCPKNLTLSKLFIKAQERYKRDHLWRNIGPATVTETQLLDFASNFKRSLIRQSRMAGFPGKSRPRKAHSLNPGDKHPHLWNSFADVKGFQNYHRQDQAYHHIVKEHPVALRQADPAMVEVPENIQIMANPFYLKDKFYDREISLLSCYEAVEEFERHCREEDDRWIASFKDLLANIDRVVHEVIRLDLINRATLLGYGECLRSGSKTKLPGRQKTQVEVDSLNAIMRSAICRETSEQEEVNIRMAYELINADYLKREVDTTAEEQKRPIKIGPSRAFGKIQQINISQPFPHNGRQPAQAGIHSLSTIHKSAGGELRTPKAGGSSFSQRNFQNNLTASRSQVHKTPKLSRAHLYFANAEADDTEPSQYVPDLQRLQRNLNTSSKKEYGEVEEEEESDECGRLGGPLQRIGRGQDDEESVRTPSPEDDMDIRKSLRLSKSSVVLQKPKNMEALRRKTKGPLILSDSKHRVKKMKAHFISPAIKIRCVKNLEEDISLESVHFTDHNSGD